MSRNVDMFIKPDLLLEFQAKCKLSGVPIIFTSIDRDYKEQTALFAQGRDPLAIVNGLRRAAGLPLIGQKENSYKVTWTMNSYHIINLEDDKLTNDKSYAADFAVIKNGKATWDLKANVNNNEVPDYLECARIAEAMGFTAGYKFKNPDYPHIQLPRPT